MPQREKALDPGPKEMKLPNVNQKPKKSHEQLLAELKQKNKDKMKRDKERLTAKCPFGCPWSTKNKYRKQVKVHVKSQLEHRIKHTFKVCLKEVLSKKTPSSVRFHNIISLRRAKDYCVDILC